MSAGYKPSLVPRSLPPEPGDEASYKPSSSIGHFCCTYSVCECLLKSYFSLIVGKKDYQISSLLNLLILVIVLRLHVSVC